MTEIATVVGGAPSAVIVLLAAAALAALVALSRAHGRQLERRLAMELGPPTMQPEAAAVETAQGYGGGGRAEALLRPDAELRITLEELLEQRDHLLEAVQRVQDRIHQVRAEERHGRPSRHAATSNVIVLRARPVARSVATTGPRSGRSN